MNLKRAGALLGKELLHGPRSYIFVMAIIMPLAVSLLVNLLLGTFLSEKPALGITGDTGSGFVKELEGIEAIEVSLYRDDAALQRAVERGAADMGIMIPDGLDTAIGSGGEARLQGYTWGESLAKARLTITTAVNDAARSLAGLEAPVTVRSVTLGDEASMPWSDRLLPFIVMMAVFLGGLMIPATSIITEKNKKTINAVLVTPATIADVFAAKGALGLLVSLFMGILILVINQSFGTHPLLLVLLVGMGGLMATELGLLLGTIVKDFATLFSIWKTAGIILFAPVIIYLFPGVPQWIGRIFPTYYFLQPVVDISLFGAGWADIAVNVFILLAIIVVLGGVAAAATRRTLQFAS